ncbi:hypothetical protein CHUAL_006126 [Chamberlinius hualienensis]
MISTLKRKFRLFRPAIMEEICSSEFSSSDVVEITDDSGVLVEELDQSATFCSTSSNKSSSLEIPSIIRHHHHHPFRNRSIHFEEEQSSSCRGNRIGHSSVSIVTTTTTTASSGSQSTATTSTLVMKHHGTLTVERLEHCNNLSNTIHGGGGGAESSESSPSWASSSTTSNTPNFCSDDLAFEFNQKCATNTSSDNLHQLSPVSSLFQGQTQSSTQLSQQQQQQQQQPPPQQSQFNHQMNHTSHHLNSIGCSCTSSSKNSIEALNDEQQQHNGPITEFNSNQLVNNSTTVTTTSNVKSSSGPCSPCSPDSRCGGGFPFYHRNSADRIQQKRGSGEMERNRASKSNGRLARLLRRTHSAGCSKDVPAHALFLREKLMLDYLASGRKSCQLSLLSDDEDDDDDDDDG